MDRPASDLSKPVGAAPPGLSPRSQLAGPGSTLHRISWSPDGSRLAAASSGRGPILWEMSSGGEVCREPLAGAPGPSWDVAWSPDGQRLAAGQVLREALVWLLPSGELL